MRLLLLALMIALLPLRGWVGDAMATEMALGHSFATKNVATEIYVKRTASHLDVASEVQHTECHGHAGAAGDVSTNAPESQDNANHDHCSNCSACQICHTIAAIAMTDMMAESAMPPVLRPAGGIRFASTVAAPHLKPPIS